MSLAGLIVTLAVYQSVCARDFAIDYDANTFLKDGKAFRYVSGSLNYFNVPHKLWEQRLSSMQLSGVNVIQTAIEWRSHEPNNTTFNFTGQNDVVKFIGLAQKIGLLVNVQIGPFINSNRDMGGLPWWLLSRRSPMKLRSADPSFLDPVDRWFSVLLPKLKPLLYRSGGPIILVQLENQYGSSGACESNYTNHLLETAQRLLGNETVFVTADVATDDALKCGRIEGCLATVSFDAQVDPQLAVQTLRRYQPTGPLVNSGFATAASDEWGQRHHTLNETTYANRLDEQLSLNMSVNIAMFHGGSQWYFDSGANFDNDTFSPFTTSFDLDAPLNEAGDPTGKFFAIKKVIRKWFQNVPDKDPVVSPKLSNGPFKMPLIFDYKFIISHMEKAGMYKTSSFVDAMENFGFDYGLVAYSTQIVPRDTNGTVILSLGRVRDRGYVYVDGELQSIVGRTENADVTLHVTNSSRLDIVVENQGRISNTPEVLDRKGLISNVTIGDSVLGPWKVFQLPRSKADLEKPRRLRRNIPAPTRVSTQSNSTQGFGIYGDFIMLEANAAHDTFLKFNGFTKGFVLLNGNHLGRYWPSQGPQKTMYVPSVYFNTDLLSQEVVIIEQEQAGVNPSVEFVNTPIVESPV